MRKKLTKKEQAFLDLLGNRILVLRNEKGISQTKLAKGMKTQHNRVSELENGKVNPKITTLLKVAKLLDISIAELVSLTGGVNPK